MTIHPELSVVAFSAKLYAKKTWSEEYEQKNGCSVQIINQINKK